MIGSFEFVPDEFLCASKISKLAILSRPMVRLSPGPMKELLHLLLHLLNAVARLLGRGGTKALVAENLLIKQQLLILTRSRQRAPNPMPHDRILLGF